MSWLAALVKQVVKNAPKETKVAKGALSTVKREPKPIVSDTQIIDQQRHDLGKHFMDMAHQNPHVMKYGADPITLESLGLYGDSPGGAVIEYSTPFKDQDAFKAFAGGRQGVSYNTMGIDKGIPGSQLYQALWHDANKSGRVNYTDGLSPVNENRRTDNMLSRGIRDHMEGVPVLDSIWLAPSQAKGMGMTATEFAALHPAEKIGALAQLSRANLGADRHAAPFLEKFLADPTLENATTQSAGLHAKLKRLGPDVEMYNGARAFGPSTMMRGSMVDDFMKNGTTSVPSDPIFYKKGGRVK